MAWLCGGSEGHHATFLLMLMSLVLLWLVVLLLLWLRSQSLKGVWVVVAWDGRGDRGGEDMSAAHGQWSEWEGESDCAHRAVMPLTKATSIPM